MSSHILSQGSGALTQVAVGQTLKKKKNSLSSTLLSLPGSQGQKCSCICRNFKKNHVSYHCQNQRKTKIHIRYYQTVGLLGQGRGLGRVYGTLSSHQHLPPEVGGMGPGSPQKKTSRGSSSENLLTQRGDKKA